MYTDQCETLASYLCFKDRYEAIEMLVVSHIWEKDMISCWILANSYKNSVKTKTITITVPKVKHNTKDALPHCVR